MPTLTDFDITAGDTSSAVRTVLEAKYMDVGSWAQWGLTLLEKKLVDVTAKLGSDTVNADIAAIQSEIGAIVAFTPGTITGGTGDFTTGNTALSALQTRIAADITAYSTGLGSAVETAMFNRETARHNAQRAAAYTEITTQFSARGFDMPPGALLAKQTEINSESSIRLTDSSGKILEESARLALDYNKSMLSVAVQLQGILADVFNSKELRLFEASKAAVMLAAETYKNGLSLVTAKADIALKKGELSLTAKARQLELEVTTLQGMAQAAASLIAASLNSVNVSTSMAYSASTAIQAQNNQHVNVQYTATPGVLPTLHA